MPYMEDMEIMPGVDDGNDGSIPLLSGFEVLGRILAQAGGIRYTKALLDSGDLPEGAIIDELTAPIQYAGEGLIASVENTGNGEATITVQATSMGVAVGFPCKGVMVYVEDPDTGEDVAYCYLDLHEHPTWIRPQGNAVNSFATFSIQSIVTGAASVTAVINPKALARIVDLERYALLGHSHEISDIIGLSDILDDHSASIDLLNDLVSGDMPGGVNRTADFASGVGLIIRDGVLNVVARSVTA
ncbi:MAG: hypothetical protein HFF19_10520 [Oscillospiraceae bacterium]|nr:hypothetical protein [Oscillospiraceae bacterium]